MKIQNASYISNLIKGENYPSYDNGYPRYANLKCKTIKKKLKSYKLYNV